MPALFGTSGIRGLYETEINVDLARKLGAACAKKYKKIVVGRDHRLSGPELDDGFSKAAGMMGAEVIQIGVAPTPAVTFAAGNLGAACAVVVTASHNPPEYNGFKFFNPDGSAFTKEQEKELESLVEYAPVIMGRAKAMEIAKFQHNDKILSTYAGKFAGMKVVVNCNGGAASATAVSLFEKLGCTVVPLFDKADGTYRPNPKGVPNPELGDWNRIADLDTTEKAVKDHSAEIGFVFDGDADRVLVVGPSGAVSAEKTLFLFASNFAKDSEIVSVVDGSSILDSVCKVTRVAVGDVHVSRKLKSLGANSFGGEGCSGTYIWPSMQYCPDGIFSAVKMLELVVAKGPIDKLVKEIPATHLKREKLQVSSFEARVMAMEKALLKVPSDAKLNDTDGIRLDYPDGGWLLVRPSGTEPILRLTAEGPTEQRAEELLKLARKLIEQS